MWEADTIRQVLVIHIHFSRLECPGQKGWLIFRFDSCYNWLNNPKVSIIKQVTDHFSYMLIIFIFSITTLAK